MLGNRGGLLKHTKLISDYKLGISFFRLGKHFYYVSQNVVQSNLNLNSNK